MKDKHTPRPWVFVPAGNRPEITANGDKVLVARVESLSFVADAHLIAAAPDLLEALIDAEVTLAQICEGQHPDNVCCHHLRAARAAIAKAKGNQ
jgi:hypothetical protein